MFSEKLSDAMSSSRMGVDMQIDELAKVLWLSATLFFIVGGYWLLRVCLLRFLLLDNRVIHLHVILVSQRSHNERNRWS